MLRYSMRTGAPIRSTSGLSALRPRLGRRMVSQGGETRTTWLRMRRGASASPVAPPGQRDHELGEPTRLALERQLPAVPLDHDVVADREPEPGALPGRLGGEERGEDAIAERRRD